MSRQQAGGRSWIRSPTLYPSWGTWFLCFSRRRLTGGYQSSSFYLSRGHHFELPVKDDNSAPSRNLWRITS